MVNERSNYIILDLETGGLNKKNPKEHYKLVPITSVALLCIDSISLQEMYRETWYQKPYAGLEYQQQALDVTGITMSQINSGLSTQKTVERMIALFEQANPSKKKDRKPILVGHNLIDFDLQFLEFIFTYERKNLYDYIDQNHLDTLRLARLFWFNDPTMTKFKLGICCERIGISASEAHTSMGDVESNTELFKYFVNKIRQSEANKDGQFTTQGRFRDRFQF